MSELNKDGLVPGQAVDFTTLMQTIRKKQITEGLKDDNTNKPELCDNGNTSVSSVAQTKTKTRKKKPQS